MARMGVTGVLQKGHVMMRDRDLFLDTATTNTMEVAPCPIIAMVGGIMTVVTTIPLVM